MKEMLQKISRKTALMRLDNLTEAQADAEIERIMKEQEEMLALADPTAFQTEDKGEEPKSDQELVMEQEKKTDEADEFGGYDPKTDGL